MHIAAPVGPLDPRWIETAQTLPIAVWTATPDGAVEFVNHRWEAMTGAPADAILGDAWPAMVHPGDRERTVAAYRDAFATGKPLRIDVRVRRADGSYGWVRSQADPVRDASGSVVRWFGVALDVGEAHRTEERLRGLADSLPLMVWTADATGWIDWYNRRWYEFTGQTPEEAAGWGWQAAHHPDDFLEVMRRWPHSIATGEPFEMEFRLRGSDGIFHWFLSRVEPVRDDAGKLVRWYGSNINIDAQRFTLERTRRIAETLQTVFLPKQLPQFADLRLDAVYLGAEKDALVGGDWYDAFELPDGRLIFSIGDVAGHGLEASVAVGRIRQSIFTLALRESDPGKILVEVDRILTYQDPGTMVTAIVGYVDAARSTLYYAVAGHPPPMIAYKKHEPAAMLPCGDPPLGIGCDLNPVVHAVPVPRDAVIAFYTDGLVEFSRDVETIERKLSVAIALMVGNTSIARPARAIQELVFDDMPAADDAALLLLQFSAVDSSLTHDNPAPLEKVWRFHSSSAHSAQTSRREVMAYLARMAGDAEGLFEVELIIGEIFANTVRHAPGLVEVAIEWFGENPIATVRDTGAGLHYLETELPKDDLSESGRGIFLIKQLAAGVTLNTRPGYGTELRVVLPVKRSIESDQAERS